MKDNEVKEAMDVLRAAMKEDVEPGSYAHGWHCNIACMCADSIMAAQDIEESEAFLIGNEAASRFMKLCFDIETKV